jgi:hypothetical protein
MSNHKRYDTIALQGRMQDEEMKRRLWGMGVLSLIAGVATYFLVFAGDSDVKESEDAGAVALVMKAQDRDIAPPSTHTSAQTHDSQKPLGLDDSADAAVPVKNKANIKVSLSRKGTFWVNGKKVGKFKRKQLKLKPGTYSFKAKIGRKTRRAELRVEAGQSFQIKFSHRKKKAKIKKLR